MRSLADILLTEAIGVAVAKAEVRMKEAADQAKSDRNTPETKDYFTTLASDYKAAIKQLRGATLMVIP